MGAPKQDVCAPWCDLTDAPAPCSDYGFDADVYSRFALVASNILFKLSFRRYPGICRESVRPCFHAADCRCCSLGAVVPPSLPAVEIVSVTVDGVDLAASAYRVDNYRELVRLDTGDGITSWPCWQDQRLPLTELGTWGYTYDYGLEPPEDGVMAAASLACQLSVAWNPATTGECRLPKRVTSMVRQGVSIAVLDPLDLFEQGRTGIPEVDLFLAAERMGRKDRPATVRRLGSGRRARRCTTC